MLHLRWSARSLRFWIAVCMAIALAPLAVSAVAGYVLLNHGVIAPFHHVLEQQRNQIAPTQNLRVLIWDTLPPVDEFVDEGGAQRPQLYRALRTRIEQDFARIHGALPDSEAKTLLERARDDWTVTDRLASELISVVRPPGDPQSAILMERFHGSVAATSDKLGATYEFLARGVTADHDTALRSYERSAWLAGIAGAISLLAVIGGVVLVGRVMSASVDRLVDGAERFAEGDRDHRIEIRIPPELKRVAGEFNRMIARIHESETALSELAHRDGLTRLLNRRAFDEALAETHSRMRRTDEEGALLTLDIDHFKGVNDSYGHAAGDEVLRAFARSMTSALRPFDQAFRVGGEEFSVLLPGTTIEVAEDVAERLRETIAATPVNAAGKTIPITASIGVAKASRANAPREWAEAADAALYRAKTTGRNKVVLIDEYGVHEGARSTPTATAVGE